MPLIRGEKKVAGSSSRLMLGRRRAVGFREVVPEKSPTAMLFHIRLSKSNLDERPNSMT